MPKVHTTFSPDKAVDVSEEEAVDLERQGLLVDSKKAHKTSKTDSEKEN